MTDKELKQCLIADLRTTLDAMMYSGPVELETFHHLRKAYDKICQANDEIMKI